MLRVQGYVATEERSCLPNNHILKRFSEKMECLPTFMPESQKSSFNSGDAFPRDSLTMLSPALLVEFGREVESAPEKKKSVLFTGKSSLTKQESFQNASVLYHPPPPTALPA